MSCVEETLMLLGGERSGETIVVACGLPWIRMPRRLPMQLSPPKQMPTMVVTADFSELYKRKLIRVPNADPREFFVLQGLDEDGIAQALTALCR